MATGVRIEGGRRLRSTLRAAGGDLQDLRAANRAAVEIVRPVATVMAPTGPTGKLRRSVRTGATTRAGILRAGRKTVPYANPVHWGWPTRPNPAKQWRGGPITPNPFLERAAKQTEPAWVPVYFAEIESAISKVKGK